jgi:AraC family transcriptional regulator
MPGSVPLERFVGPVIHAHGSGEVGIHEGTFDGGLVVPAHVHDVAVISLVLSGGATEQVERGVREITARDLIVTPAFALHGYQFRQSGRWLNMQLSDAWLARAADGRKVIADRSEIVRAGSAAAWAMRVRTEVQSPDSASNLAIDGAMMLMIAEIARARVDAASTRPRWLRRVEDAIESSIAAPPGLDTLSALAGVHPSHLLRTFRRYHGATIANFVRQRRIERARTELATSTRPLSTIALDAGFADQAHFTRVFKQTFGETPGRYARSIRAR